MLLVLVAALAATAAAAAPVSLGDRFVRAAGNYDAMPLTTTSAAASGWVPSNQSYCHPELGISYTHDDTEPTKGDPMTLYYTSAGQLAGVRIDVFGDVKPELVGRRLWRPVAGAQQQYYMAIAFRNSTEMCGEQARSAQRVGHTLLVNPHLVPGGVFRVPTTRAGADASGWSREACIDGMGVHHFYDFAGAGNMTFFAKNLLPITTMYDPWTNELNAIFIFSADVQQALWSARGWDKIPLPTKLWCLNVCTPKCTLHDDGWVSTMHLW
eukprot:CAMPEP_0198337170 /NCGR_PEP_ID=MMETSP1450-20131203/25431_1 /TAXON_ID=753684 ORGANISM="Madagascaria erythrocladiodes, Strain CCMP3234" /NCGR_SAMPLE_ID=MMETSP1450 /ASSEMBLY_ACC=CAM_ASM_001115 /LENGTH=267 /DNA_ID=CAMNT_0044041957 /DNA_START=42 /DNA_END=842 /DNA_ORIENTATION=+